MVFKLVRIDTQEPSKIQLSIGTHVIGRGKFLHNDDTDKRVSRNHAELEVTTDTVHLKSLHHNPCFYIIKKSIETHLLLQDNTVNLCHGDKFGLLPDHFWYEVLYCPGEDAEERAVIPEPTENGIDNAEDRMDRAEDPEENVVTPEISAAEEEAINFEDGEEQGDSARSASPSLLSTEQVRTEPETASLETDRLEIDRMETAVLATVKQEDTEDYEAPLPVPLIGDTRSPAKRNHSSRETSPADVKRVKTEPVDASDAAAGPSNGQQAASDADSKDNLAAPASPAKPQAPVRERCIYGANCYRRNPQHKAQFSHPRDADWGGGERGVCPYGRACRKADPRHWQHHTHPPGTQPPSAQPHRPGKRQKRRQRNDSVSDEDSPVDNLIVTGKRARKPVNRQDWTDDSDVDKDPYGTDESDEWQPPSDVPTSQDFSQDL